MTIFKNFPFTCISLESSSNIRQNIKEQFIEKIALSVIFISSNNPLDLFEHFIESINKNPIPRI